MRRVAFRHSGSPRFRRACCLPRVAAAPADVVALHEHRCERNTNEHSTVTFATAPAPRKSRCVRATRRAAPRRGAVSRVVANYTSVRHGGRSRRKIANCGISPIHRRSAFAPTPHGLRLGRKRKGRYALHRVPCGDRQTTPRRRRAAGAAWAARAGRRGSPAHSVGKLSFWLR